MLLAAIAAAGSGGFDTHAWQIPWTLATFFDFQGYWHDYEVSQQTALTAARHCGNETAQARAHRHLAVAKARLGQHHDARRHQEQALELSRKLGIPHYEAEAWDSLGYAYHHLRDHRQATSCCRHALQLHQQVGDQASQALVLTHLGDACSASGNSPAARNFWQQALAILDDLHHSDAERVRIKLQQLDAAAVGDQPGREAASGAGSRSSAPPSGRQRAGN